MPAERKPAVPSLSLDLTVSADRRFLDTVGALAASIAARAGCSKQEAGEIGAAVVSLADGVLEHALQNRPDAIMHIHFGTTGARLEILVRYAARGEAGSRLANLEHGLGSRRDGETRLDAIRRILDQVEFGRSGVHEFCRLTRTLSQPA